MNIGEYIREAMSVAAYDKLLDRLDLAVTNNPPEPEDTGRKGQSRIEDCMQREAEQIYRRVRAQTFDINPDRRQTTREQGRHLAFCRLNGAEGYAVIERLPVTDGSQFGCWRERPITQVFWHASEERWRCGCREFVRTRACTHVAALAIVGDDSQTYRAVVDGQADARLCECGHPAFVGGLCTICHLFAEERWLTEGACLRTPYRAQGSAPRRQDSRSGDAVKASGPVRPRAA